MNTADPAEMDWGLLDAPGEQVASAPLRVLLACNYDIFNAATVCEHINAFVRHSHHEVFVLSRVGEVFRGVDLSEFDVVIIHYSLFLALDTFVSPRAKHALAAFKGLKVAFIQDEYRFVDATMQALATCGVGVVFTCVPKVEIPRVYTDPRLKDVRFEQVLTGYVSEWLVNYPPLPMRARPIMVGYRGRTYPAWHGDMGREKVEIGRRFKADAKRFNLRTDIAWSERSRLYGPAWTHFLRNCRATLAVESGASVFDFDGTIATRTETYTALMRAPRDLDGSKVPYTLVRERYFADMENRIDLAQVSPRVFEAVALRTMLIAYPGGYSGVLEPWRHYVPLAKDHSNMAEVAAVLRDPERITRIVMDAFVEIARQPAYGFGAFIEHVDRVLEEAVADLPRASRRAYVPEAFHKVFHFYHVNNPHEPGLPLAKGLLNRARRQVGRARRLAGRLVGRIGGRA